MMGLSVGERLATIETKVGQVSEDIKEIKESVKNLDNRYATLQEHNTLRTIVYAFIGFITSILVVFITWVFNKVGGF